MIATTDSGRRRWRRMAAAAGAATITVIAPPAAALPNAIVGPLARAESPLDNRDLTEELLAEWRRGGLALRLLAAEAGLALDRSSRFDDAAARRALAAGLPVVVWRRFSHGRDQLHARFARHFARDATATLPDPHDPRERASWPGPDAPLHSSVLTGYHDARREFLFLESWSDRATARRIRAEELAATAYLTFIFRP